MTSIAVYRFHIELLGLDVAVDVVYVLSQKNMVKA